MSSIPVGTAADSAWAARLLTGRVDEARGGALPGAAAPASADREPPAAAVADAVQVINTSLQGQSLGVRFEVDSATDRLVVKVVDRDSGELIRQMPSEAVLRLAQVLGRAPGALVSQSA